MIEPQIKSTPSFTPVQQLLFAGALIFLLTNIFLAAFYFPDLPQSVPSHFDFSGKPNAWGGKGTIILALVTAIVICSLMLLLSLFPQIYNFMIPVTRRNAPRQYSMARTLLLLIACEISFFFAYTGWRTMMVAMGQANGLGQWAVPGFILAILIPVIVYIPVSFRAR